MDSILSGLIACPGCVRGKAFVASNNMIENSKMEYGQILVLKYSSPEFFELYLKASAIITEIGGITCHAASLSRDLNIPCLVSVDNALSIIQTGNDLIVDANEGKIYVQLS